MNMNESLDSVTGENHEKNEHKDYKILHFMTKYG